MKVEIISADNAGSYRRPVFNKLSAIFETLFDLLELPGTRIGKEMDSRELDPAFYIAKLGSFYLILGLSFAGD